MELQKQSHMGVLFAGLPGTPTQVLKSFEAALQSLEPMYW